MRTPLHTEAADSPVMTGDSFDGDQTERDLLTHIAVMMIDLLVLSPVIVGAIMIVGLLLELGLGKIGFLTKGLGLTFDQAKNRYELSAGPIVGVFVIGAALVIAPLVIDYFLVAKKTFTVSGKVEVEGQGSPVGTSIISCYPLAQVYPTGEFTSVRISKNDTGQFPDLAFQLAGYETASVILRTASVSKFGSNIHLNDTVVLRRRQE